MKTGFVNYPQLSVSLTCIDLCIFYCLSSCVLYCVVSCIMCIVCHRVSSCVLCCVLSCVVRRVAIITVPLGRKREGMVVGDKYTKKKDKDNILTLKFDVRRKWYF